MAKLRIETFRIRDLAKNPKLFRAYEDPNNYVSNDYDQWIEIFLTNPLARDDDVAVIAGIDGNTVVGKMGLCSGLMSMAGERSRVRWIQGFFLDEAYRKAGVGGMIMLRALSLKENILGSGASDPNAVALFKASGFKSLGPLRRFVLFYNAGVIARKLTKNPLLTHVISTAGEPLLKSYYGLKAIHKGKRPLLEYKPVDRFDSSIDDLLARERRNYFPRDSRSLNWILDRKKFWPFLVYRDGSLLGYCLLQKAMMQEVPMHNVPAMSVGRLKDHYLADESIVEKEDLILFAIDFFKDKHVDIFECQVLDDDYDKICQKYGLVHLGGNRVFLRLQNASNKPWQAPWLVTFGVSDVIFYEG